MLPQADVESLGKSTRIFLVLSETAFKSWGPGHSGLTTSLPELWSRVIPAQWVCPTPRCGIKGTGCFFVLFYLTVEKKCTSLFCFLFDSWFRALVTPVCVHVTDLQTQYRAVMGFLIENKNGSEMLSYWNIPWQDAVIVKQFQRGTACIVILYIRDNWSWCIWTSYGHRKVCGVWEGPVNNAKMQLIMKEIVWRIYNVARNIISTSREPPSTKGILFSI